MNLLYNISAGAAQAVLPVTTFFSPKMKEFVRGRKETFSILATGIKEEDRTIWFHMASLGEFEQGLPIIEIVKKHYPAHKIVVSFFSPSGYENKKNTPLAHEVVYLPLDTPKNVTRFLNALRPEMAFFIKYEFWPNYLKELKVRNIPTFLISGGFRKDQIFFKPYGNWMIKSLSAFTHFFVQNSASQELLKSIGYSNVTVSGDTRFDRVILQLKQDNHLEYIEDFIDNKLCIVAGSTWPEDEELLKEFINMASIDVKFIIAPHQIKKENIKKFRESLNKNVILYSEKENASLAHFQVIIIDNIGLLSKIYSYADIAYVGGAVGTTGLHNILEPATFGVPVITGPNFENFPEAKQLQRLAGLYSVASKEELAEILNRFLEDDKFRKRTGMITGHFVSSNAGATQIIADYLEKFAPTQ